ncbi:hypothetical protein JCM33374_g1781 [Metschnikowia sp. JCM 33374]|nr:hypothetical protein JCM33374_g1781 [Metschnikowia sp. JCM 33374]
MISRGLRMASPCVRTYHSTSHPASNIIINAKSPEAVLFSKAIEHVPKFGFSKKAIDTAVRDLEYSDSIQSAITASTGHTSEYSLVLFWLKSQRQKLYDHVLDVQSPFHKISDEYDRAAYLLNKRLSFNKPVIGQLTGALSQLVMPYNVVSSLEELHNLSDDVAFYAGDMSNDSAWYAKRLLLSSIYVKSELFSLQDTSKDFADSIEYVNQSVSSVKSMGYAYTSIEQWAVFNAISSVNLIKSQLARG